MLPYWKEVYYINLFIIYTFLRLIYHLHNFSDRMLLYKLILIDTIKMIIILLRGCLKIVPM